MDYKSFLTDTWTRFSQLFIKYVKTTFVGTRAEWDALTLEEKKKYDLANFTDDTATGTAIISDSVTEDDMNPVTSNAVSKYGIRFDTSASSATPDITHTFIKFRKLENIITMDVQDANQTGVSIDFDYGNGVIRFYKMVNGSATEPWNFNHS